MIRFDSDYVEGAHPLILEKLMETNMEQTIGYGEDSYCSKAAETIRELCSAPKADVHFLVGGTQTNVTVITAALRPHQGVITAGTGHIQVHETGAVEAYGHKIIVLDSENGKLCAQQVEAAVDSHYLSESREHMVQPKMVYISNPTELGTIYKKNELSELSRICKKYGLFLFLDGARLGYGLCCKENELELRDLTEYCDTFYIGGTKNGALFGEALVIVNERLKEDFRYQIKQKGGLLAKGRLLGIQFLTLFQDGLYFKMAEHAIVLAEYLQQSLAEMGILFYVNSPTNQQFPILPNEVVAKLGKSFTFSFEAKVSESHSAVRFCTSWATKRENVTALIEALKRQMGIYNSIHGGNENMIENIVSQ